MKKKWLIVILIIILILISSIFISKVLVEKNIGLNIGSLEYKIYTWSDEEKEFAYLLSQDPEYQHPKGSYNPGKPDNELIALELNIQYHDYKEVRSASAVKKQLSQYRKSLDDIVV